LCADPERVHMAPRSRKGCWRMSPDEIVRHALNNRWREEQGVPDRNARAAIAASKNTRSQTAWTKRIAVKAIWTVLYYGPDARV
jgi:hypothetical protein